MKKQVLHLLFCIRLQFQLLLHLERLSLTLSRGPTLRTLTGFTEGRQPMTICHSTFKRPCLLTAWSLAPPQPEKEDAHQPAVLCPSRFANFLWKSQDDFAAAAWVAEAAATMKYLQGP